MSRVRIGLLDCNNFFASCERVFRPDLKQRPVVVLSSNDGCIIARSQEVKDKGIPMGVPYFQVKDSLKDMKAAVFSSNFTLYRDLSARVCSLVSEAFQVVEQYSIDEMFFVLEPATTTADLVRLRNRIQCELGLPVSVGVGFSKTQAKYANQLAKRTTGLQFLARSDDPDFLKLPLREVWGVGQGISAQLAARGLYSVSDLLSVPDTQLKQWFGVVVERLKSELAGGVCYPVAPQRLLQKTYVSSQSLPKATAQASSLRAALAFHVEQVATDLWRNEQKAELVRLFLYPDRHSDYCLRGVSPSASLTVPTREMAVLQTVAKRLFDDYFDPTVPYKKVGVMVGNLMLDRYETGTLIPEASRPLVSDMVLAINHRLGSVLHIGSLPTKHASFAARQEHISPAYTTRWADIALVKAG